MKKISLLFLLILLSCGPSKKAIIVEYSESIIPELNKQSQSEIGETLIEKESGFKYDGIKLLNGTKAEKAYVYREVKAGDIFIKKSEMTEYDLFEGTDQYFGIAIPKNGGNPSFYFYNGHVSFYKTIENLTYEKIKVPVPEKQYFKQEFIYNGKVGSGIKFIYREFVDNTARPAFTQDLQYDLSEGNIVGFKGLRIEIINASNTKIDYKVLSNFNK